MYRCIWMRGINYRNYPQVILTPTHTTTHTCTQTQLVFPTLCIRFFWAESRLLIHLRSFCLCIFSYSTVLEHSKCQVPETSVRQPSSAHSGYSAKHVSVWEGCSAQWSCFRRDFAFSFQLLFFYIRSTRSCATNSTLFQRLGTEEIIPIEILGTNNCGHVWACIKYYISLLIVHLYYTRLLAGQIFNNIYNNKKNHLISYFSSAYHAWVPPF